MATFKDLAICIRQWDWSETSQTVSLLGRDTGIVRAMAKGSKRADPRFSGGLETLTLGEMMAIMRPAASLATLTAWDLRETFPALRRSLSAFYAGMCMADLVQHTVSEHDPHPVLFDGLVGGLRSLGDGERDDRMAVLRFQWIVLCEIGYRPEVARDVRTGRGLEGAETYGFAPHEGGLTVAPAPGTLPDRPPVWLVRAGTVAVLRELAGAGDAAAIGRTSAGPWLDRANRLLGAYLREVLGRDVVSLSLFLDGASMDPRKRESAD